MVTKHMRLGLLVGVFAVGSAGALVYYAQATPLMVPALPVGNVVPPSGSVEVRAGATNISLQWSDLLGPDGLVDATKAVTVLTNLKQSVERPFQNAYLDLEARAVRDATDGMGLDLAGAAAALRVGAVRGVRQVELPLMRLAAPVGRDQLKIADISHALGTFTTKFSVADRERNFNLKLAASKLNGVILQPGQTMSFNEVVGERSQENGYKIAHVIEAGEMVDGLAGGTCQISTTLFSAAFFAGLSVVSQTPHSRPSVYAEMGLDATVVWPNVDLQLANPYEFPVAIHYKVARGEATVEILGAKRPWDKIEFERRIVETTPYTQEYRDDPTLLIGTSRLDQPGFDGYKIVRQRHFYRDGKIAKSEKWTVAYRPVVEYTRVGTSLDLNAPPAAELTPHMPKPPKSERLTISQ